MKIISASYRILWHQHLGEDFDKLSDKDILSLKRIEQIGRVCYKSEDKITEDSYVKFLERLLRQGHEAMIEHSTLTVLFTVDRGVSHELVRHRLASFAQESTRYCNYTQDKFGNELTFIAPYNLSNLVDNSSSVYIHWVDAMKNAEKSYFKLIESGVTPQMARSVLPNSLKTEIVITANYREWRHIFKLRTAKDAHPQMQEVMIPLLKEVHSKIPIIFDDFFYDEQIKDRWNVEHNW